MPHTPRQYLRALLLKLGIGNEAAFRLNLNEVRADDIFLCSYPKSGNTWLRFLIAHLISSRTNIHPKNIDEFVPDVYMASEIANKLKSPRILKTHHALYSSYPKTIYIVRDVRDVLLSYFHYQKSLGAYDGSLSQFIAAADTLHPFGSWSEHVKSALEFQQLHPQRILILRYEDLQQNPESELHKLVAFAGIKPVRSITDAVEFSAFGRLRKLEDEHGSAFSEKSGANFFRSGKTGEGRAEFSAEENALLLKQHGELLRQLGYSM
ncbi:MAG: sulfotransferase domain-containing protein [Bacteroidia bacterium]